MNKTILYMLQEQSNVQMMSYVVQTKEGKLLVIDGGNKVDAEHLMELLVNLNGSKPTVDLWILTHPHSDHIDALVEILYGSKSIHIDKICDHFLTEEFYEPYEPQSVCGASLRKYNLWKEKHPEKFFTLTKDQKIKVGSVEITILYVPDGSITGNASNNSSVLFRLDTEEHRILFTGDLGAEAGDYVLSHVHHEELRAEYVQMAHHGQNGVRRRFYEAVGASVCLWNTPDWLWENDGRDGHGTGPYKTLEVRKWMEELKVQKHYITKDGDQIIEL